MLDPRPFVRVMYAATAVCLFALSARPAFAQLPALIDAPPPPQAPATIARDGQQRATIRAVRVTTPMKIDGKLDEEVYKTVQPVGGFIQQTPKPGAPATEPSDVWVLFDDTNLYITMLLHETHPERRIGTELRRDAQGLTNDDNVMLSIDTFYDRRNAFNFQVNSVGGFRDQLVTDANANAAWNTVWDVRVADAPEGQAFELVIPFKSLRYKGGGPQVWGLNIRRTTRWKNETSFINPVPVAYAGAGILQLSTAAALVGVETPEAAKNLELKPYAIGSLTTDHTQATRVDNKGKANGGFDFKYGLTRSLTTDVTVNTDFAQVEEDVQQVNLTRFSLFFPEKRDFFLEGLGNFGFAGQGTGANTDGTSDQPTLFFSRRIGLSNGIDVPVRVGARVTGRAGPFEIGFLNIETGDKAEAKALATNFTAARVRRNILKRSNLGVITTIRQPGLVGTRNMAYGGDGNFRFYQSLETNLYIAGTSTENKPTGDNLSYRAKIGFTPDRYGLTLEHLKVGANFNPEMGFVRRSDYRNTVATARRSIRLKKNPRIRRLTWQTSVNTITNSADTRRLNRDAQGDFIMELHNSDQLTVSYLDQYEFLPARFLISPGVAVPTGSYGYRTLKGTYALGTQRLVSGSVTASTGTFYGDGSTRTAAGFTGRVSFSPLFVMEPSVSLNKVELPYGSFKANLLSDRIVFTPNARTQFASLFQWNPIAHSLTSSARLRWEYTPGSELFVVWTDGRNVTGAPKPGLLSRTFAVKITKLLRF